MCYVRLVCNYSVRNSGNGLNFDRKWRIMEESVLNIQHEQKTSVSFEELYGVLTMGVHRVCTGQQEAGCFSDC